MIGGILIGIGISALIFLIAWLLRRGNKPTVITYLVLIASAVALSIEGVLMLKAYDLKQNTEHTVAMVQQTITSYVPHQGLNYTITESQASAISLALSIAVPSIADMIEASDMANRTISEAVDNLRISIEDGAAKQVRKTVWILVITAIVLLILIYISFAIGEGMSLIAKNGYGSSGSTSYSNDYLNF